MQPTDQFPSHWDPRRVAVNQDPNNHFLLRPGQLLVAPGDAADVAQVLTDWKANDVPTTTGTVVQHPYGVTLFTKPPTTDDPAREVLAALATVRRKTANRPQGSVKVAPNHVFVGEAAITLTGEPRMQGGCGSSVRPARPPAALPKLTKNAGDGKGVKIAVLDTGLFPHPWLGGVQHGPSFTDTWDANADGYADDEAGHGTFISGLLLQVAPSAQVYMVKVLDSMGVGDDLTLATAISQLPKDVNIVNLSLGGYTDDDAGPLALGIALKALRREGVAVVAAAGNWGDPRPFWPAAFKQVLGVGAIEPNGHGWQRASYSDYGWWVDAVARGTAQQSTFAKNTSKEATGSAPATSDPTIAFDGWAQWDGTSFSTPVVAAVLARLMTRNRLANAVQAETLLQATFPAAPQPDFPGAVLVEEVF
jgi:hypothetical protein